MHTLRPRSLHTASCALLASSCALAVAPGALPDGAAPATDAPTTRDAAAPCALDTRYSYTAEGGLTGCGSRFEVGPDTTVVRSQSCPPGSPYATQCMAPIAGCDGSSASLGALRDALADADVRAAFANAAGGTLMFGVDPRGHDGLLVTVRRADGRAFSVGDACGTQPGCRATPAGVTQLLRVLIAIGGSVPAPSCSRDR